MKNSILALILGLFLAGCSATVDVAKMNAETRYKYASDFYKDESFDLAVKEFESFLLQFPGNEFSDDAQFYLGMSHFQRKEYLLAAFEFSKLIKNMPASSFVPESQFMLASSYYKLSPQFPLDQRYTKKAIEELQAFIDFFPADQRVADAEGKIKELHEKLGQKEFHNAEIYERMEYYSAAISYYGKVVENFHDTKFAPDALYGKIKLLVKKQRVGDAQTDIEVFLSKFPGDKRAKELSDLRIELNKKPVSLK